MRRPLPHGLPILVGVTALSAACVAGLAVGASLVAGTVRLHRLLHADGDADPFADALGPAPAPAPA
jgi:hypothetical protein